MGARVHDYDVPVLEALDVSYAKQLLGFMPVLSSYLELRRL